MSEISSENKSQTCTTTNNTITTTTNTSTTNSDQSLSRNSSFSRLNAKAPEFVPMKPQPSQLPSSLDPRLVIIPPPPPPPSFVHVLPPHHFQHHQFQQLDPRGNVSNGGSNNGDRQQLKKLVSKEKSDKDHVIVSPGSSSGGVNGGNNSGLSDEAVQKLINQVEYYFSDVNLATTDHLIKFIFKDPLGFVPVSVVASFKKIKALISSNSQLAAILRNSTKLEVSEDGKKVKRLHPLTISDMEELQARIILAENLPEDHCHQNLMKIFSVIGSVKSIRTCQPQPSNNGASSGSRSSKNDNYNYNNKLHAFVEYESVELAEKAIAELNAGDNWRNGLRVRPLLKPLMKSSPGRGKKSGNEGDTNGDEVSVSTSEQNQNEKLSEHINSEHGAQSPDHGDDQSLDKEGGQKKSRNRNKGKGRGRGHNHNHSPSHHNHSPNHHNHSPNHHNQPSRGSHVTANGEQPLIARQQPPGPRMPDGTRGFSMGRGKPIAVNTA